MKTEQKPKQTKKSNSNSSKSIFVGPNIGKMFGTDEHFQPYQMFYEINNEIAKRIYFYKLDNNKLFEEIVKHYKVNKVDVISKREYNFESKQYECSSFLVPISKSLWVFYGDNENDGRTTSILYSSFVNEGELTDLQNILVNHKLADSTIGKIHLLQKFDYGYGLKAYDVAEFNCDIKSHYNDDFAEFDSKIINHLNIENDKGLVLLHGKPGTGKTSYIRYLTKNVNKRMIFLSPEVSQQISSPEFITTLSEYPNSIIVIEDAENVIKTRRSGGSSVISNLLNLTDGLLADCLKIQLICSFNTDVSAIDKALLRKGRLIAMYEFNELKQNKAAELAIALGKTLPIKTDTILADIFNQEQICMIEKSTLQIGFSLTSKQ